MIKISAQYYNRMFSFSDRNTIWKKRFHYSRYKGNFHHRHWMSRPITTCVNHYN